MVIKYGPHGKFLACPGFPECHNTKPYYEKIGVACPKCGKDIIVRMSKKAEDTTDAWAIRNVTSWYGRNPLPKMPLRRHNAGKRNRLVCADKECGYLEEQSEPANAFGGEYR